MSEQRARRPSELLRQGFSLDELSHMYAVGRIYASVGEVEKAASIFEGLLNINPEFKPALLGAAYCALLRQQPAAADKHVRESLLKDANDPRAHLLLALASLELRDFSAAGTALGEAREHLEQAFDVNPRLKGVLEILVARYESRK